MAHPPANPERPIRILFLAANPIDTQPLRLDEEMRAIDRALREAEFRDRFEVKQQWAVRIGDLQEALLRYQPDIVHFSGHGTESSEIVLQDESGTGQAVPQDALSRLFSVLRDNIRCVVLNACYSDPQAQAIADHIDCVFGMTNAVGDDAAIEFATAFYRALGYGRAVQTAFDLGTNLIALRNLPDVDTPHLVAKKMRAADVSFVDQIAASTPRLDGVVGLGEGLGPGSGGRDRASEPVGEVSIRALFSKGVAQARTDPAAAIATYDELVARYGDSTVPDVQESVAMSIVNKGVTQGQTDHAAAIATYDELVTRYGDSTVPPVQEQVEKARQGARYSCMMGNFRKMIGHGFE